MLRSARCSNCDRHLPLGPGITKFKMPPRFITCASCGALMKTTFAYRATWLDSLLWKTCFLLAIPLGVIVGVVEWKSVGFFIFSVVCIGLFLGGLGGFIVALVAAPPLQAVIDLVAWGVRSMGVGGDDTPQRAPGMQ